MKWRKGRIEEPEKGRMKWGMKNDELRMKWRKGRIEEPKKEEWNVELKMQNERIYYGSLLRMNFMYWIDRFVKKRGENEYCQREEYGIWNLD